MNSQEWQEEHDKHDGICANCSPKKKGCCEKCYHINLAHKSSLDYCNNRDCDCHKLNTTQAEKE